MNASIDSTGSTGSFTAAQVWQWLGEVADPEIPVISIVDLGIVREVQVNADAVCTVVITPTYSGCPAMQVIADAITEALRAHGVQQIELRNQLSPAWTTDWMSASGKAALRGYGIAPPAQKVIDISGLQHRAAPASPALPARQAAAAAPAQLHAAISRNVPAPQVDCPHCGSTHTTLTSQFGSTPCKALYKCLDCHEPFDYFKCH